MAAAEARKATFEDRDVVASALASAFGEDPVCCWMSGQNDSERRMSPFWRSTIRTLLRKPDHEVYVAGDGTAAAVWRGVDNWKVGQGELVRTMPAMLRSLRLRAPIVVKLLSAMEKAHPTEPHYYLEFLGTRRDRQGHGVGRETLQPMLDRCDSEGVPAYLESSNPRNVPFYFRHGFRETGVIEAPQDGPTLTTMWREPLT